jgi:GTP-binding protein
MSVKEGALSAHPTAPATTHDGASEPQTRPVAKPHAAPAVEFRVADARYIKSGPTLQALGPALGPEFAFVGRSNVGKSSLLNTMCARRHLVRVSRTPGQTRLANLFALDVLRVSGEVEEKRTVYFVDLPGYGYAKTSKDEKRKLSTTLTEYLGKREGLLAICQLFDIRHEASALDAEVFRSLAALPPEHILVGTKLDKIPSDKRSAHLKALVKPLGISHQGVVPFSSETRIGRETLWQRLWDL